MIDPDKYRGCFTGLAVGDALGANYEGGILERILWKMIGKTHNGKHRYTDDTQMSITLARSLLSDNGVHQEHLANSFAQSYRWSRGYGPGTAGILKKIKKGADWKTVNCGNFKQGSFGNGAAMRAPVLSLYFISDHETLLHNVKLVSEITHPHPLAIEGANLIALTTSAALTDYGNNEIREHIVQFSFNGLEFGAEGPLSTNSRASYIINYRYSNLKIPMDILGLKINAPGIPYYQDANFKINIPTNKYGNFSLFGLGGYSSIDILESEKDTSEWFNSKTGEDSHGKHGMGVTGFSHIYFIDTNKGKAAHDNPIRG